MDLLPTSLPECALEVVDDLHTLNDLTRCGTYRTSAAIGVSSSRLNCYVSLGAAERGELMEKTTESGLHIRVTTYRIKQ